MQNVASSIAIGVIRATVPFEMFITRLTISKRLHKRTSHPVTSVVPEVKCGPGYPLKNGRDDDTFQSFTHT